MSTLPRGAYRIISIGTECRRDIGPRQCPCSNGTGGFMCTHCVEASKYTFVAASACLLMAVCRVFDTAMPSWTRLKTLRVGQAARATGQCLWTTTTGRKLQSHRLSRSPSLQSLRGVFHAAFQTRWSDLQHTNCFGLELGCATVYELCFVVRVYMNITWYDM